MPVAIERHTEMEARKMLRSFAVKVLDIEQQAMLDQIPDFCRPKEILYSSSENALITTE